MDSGPSTSSFPHSSGAGGSSSNTSKFRLSELLASPHERPRIPSLKVKQVQQESFRPSHIYGPCYDVTRRPHRAAAELTPDYRSPCPHAFAYLRKLTSGTKFFSQTATD